MVPKAVIWHYFIFNFFTDFNCMAKVIEPSCLYCAKVLKVFSINTPIYFITTCSHSSTPR
uniref:hypothetical protein n=1 Tax=Alkaliphilus peptidifermentans TaxID=426129 RepID=UPI0038BCADD3